MFRLIIIIYILSCLLEGCAIEQPHFDAMTRGGTHTVDLVVDPDDQVDEN